ncbi:MAG: GNAT family N-acetyltransferase [Actinomycetes bacterium]
MAVTYQRFRREDAAELVAFLLSSDWPFHAGERPSEAAILRRVADGHYDGASIETFLLRDGERLVGVLRVWDLADDTPMFDLRLRDSARGHGIGTAAVRWLADHVFGTYPHCSRIEATTRQDNVAMRRVLERCGFVKEAHYRKAWPGAGSIVHDTVGYAVLRHDWTTGRTTPVDWDR